MAKRKRRNFTPEFKALLLPISIGGMERLSFAFRLSMR